MSELLTPTRGTITTGPRVGEEVELDFPDIDDRAWFCIATAPWPCPAEGCPFVAKHVTAAHLIVVWASMDDPNLLSNATRARNAGRDPIVVRYEPAFGPPIPYYRWEALGRPVHAVRGGYGAGDAIGRPS